MWGGNSHIHSNDTDSLTGPKLGSEERAVSCDTSAKHGSHKAGFQVVGNAEDEILVRSNVTGIATIRHGAIRVVAVICV